MKYLLDTHTFIWLATRPEKLSPKVQSLLLDVDNELFLSVVSIWEMSIKACIGKLVLSRTIEQIINEQIQTNGVHILNIEIAHSLAVASLPWHHRDPFDRLLVCQSKLEDLPILGRDSVMQAYGIELVW